jgi:type IV pilus assembly protein PilM
MGLFKKEMGLDIGSRTLKGLKLKKKSGKIVLDRFFFYDLAENNDEFPIISNLGDSLKAIVEVNGLAGTSVNLSLNENDVLIFDLDLPIMPEADLAAAIANEIEQRISFPITEASIGHSVLARGEKLTIKAFCVRIDDIKKNLVLLHDSLLQPESMEVATLSNIAMLEFNGYLDAESYTALIDLGETKTSTALLKGGKLIATNSIPISLGTINSRLKQASNVIYMDAENIKKSVTAKERENGAAQEIVESVYVEILKELQRGIEFFQMTTNEQPIQKIFAIGGGSQYGSLLSAIQASCGIDTIAANPFRNIEIFTKSKSEKQNLAIGSLAPHMGTAVGLALRKLNAS